MRRSVAQDLVDFVVRGCDVTRAHSRIPRDSAVEFLSAVIFPEFAEDAAERVGSDGFGDVRVAASFEPVVDFFNVRGADLAGRKVTTRGDEELCCFARFCCSACPVELGEENIGCASLLAPLFGWRAAFCSLSKVSAARRDSKDFLRRLPLLSRQSA
jgi:hypothetical protein